METAITVDLILKILGALTVIGGGVAVIGKGIKAITTKHDKTQQYDAYNERIKDLDKKVDDLDQKVQKQINEAHIIAQRSLDNIQSRTDTKLEEMQITIDAKLQQISSELCMLSYCTLANLDGLKQQGCNGKVTEAREKLEKHLNQQAHGEIT